MFTLREIKQIERAVYSYLEWQLNVDPSMLHDFNIAFSKISSCPTHLKPSKTITGCRGHMPLSPILISSLLCACPSPHAMPPHAFHTFMSNCQPFWGCDTGVRAAICFLVNA